MHDVNHFDWMSLRHVGRCRRTADVLREEESDGVERQGDR